MSMLSIDPDYDLDPIFTSPKIIAVLNDAKGAFRAQQRSLRDSTQKNIASTGASITFRTILFPGWEQLYQGKTTKGMIFLGAGITTLGAAAAFEALRYDAREKYLAATNPTDIAAKYDTYNTYRKAGIYSIIAFAAVYVISEVDVFSETSSNRILVSAQNNSFRTLSLNIMIPM